MIVKRWGKYRALEDFADVKKDDVIDVTGVVEGSHEIMWACNGRISDWHDWDVPVIAFQSSVIGQKVKTRGNLKQLAKDARECEPSAVAIISLLKERAAAGESGAIDALEELRAEYNSEVGGREYPSGYSQGSSEVVQLSVVCNLPSHPKCLTCSHSSGWDSSGLGFCTQPLGIPSLFDENARFPITAEQYCSNHPQVKNDLRLTTTDSREKE
jgi:hypothetical protein